MAATESRIADLDFELVHDAFDLLREEWGSARAGLLPTRGDARISMGLCPEGVWGGSGAILSSIGRL